MGRGSDQATGAATAAQGISDTASGNAQSMYSTLAPALESQMAHPSGFDPSAMSAMGTQAQQSAGGVAGGAVGEGGLKAARTRNAGGSDMAMDSAARGAGETLSKGVLGTQIANANLKAKQQQDASQGLQGMYGTNLGAGVSALGQVASNTNADTDAENASWDWTKGLEAISGAMPKVTKELK